MQREDAFEIRESKRTRKRPQKYEDKDFNPNSYLSGSSEDEELDFAYSRHSNIKTVKEDPLLPGKSTSLKSSIWFIFATVTKKYLINILLHCTEQLVLLPAAFEELGEVLTKHMVELRRLLHRYGPGEISELFASTMQERKTRGKRKEEVKVN